MQTFLTIVFLPALWLSAQPAQPQAAETAAPANRTESHPAGQGNTLSGSESSGPATATA